MFIGDLPAKDIPRKILKNCSFAKSKSYEPSKAIVHEIKFAQK